MTESADLLVLTALRSELEPALRGLDPLVRVEGVTPPSALFRHVVGERTLWLGWSGIGKDATQNLLRSFGERVPRAILHLGVAGGLRDDLDAGDPVLCERVHYGDEVVDCDSPAPMRDILLAALEKLTVANGVTVDAVVSAPEQKRELADRTPGAAVVEMETYWAVQEARALGVPITCVRVVCDRVDQHLPDLSKALDAVGKPKPLAMVKHLVRRPGTLAALPGMAGAFSRAQKTLQVIVKAAAGL